MKKNKIHKTAEIQSSSIGVGNQIWQYSIVLENAIIGNNYNINCHCFIENYYLGSVLKTTSKVKLLISNF